MQDLIREVGTGRLVVVVGAGVSAQAANLPGWKSALILALDHLRMRGTASAEDICDAARQLDQAGTTGDLVLAADAIRRLLVGTSPDTGEFGG